MGTKTAVNWIIFAENAHDCEKRIPKHGDENTSNAIHALINETNGEKRIPKHGDENTSNAIHALINETNSEKRIPKHGDENRKVSPPLIHSSSL